ncbi:hypothetical protein, partial [Alteromonas sp.]|uniref:hypothetical protein n=1 Tax=Alteromonas sp. TaxID=232 RepID=UPI003EEC3E32
LLPSKSSTLKQKRLIKKYRDRSLRLLEKINPSEKRGVYHQSECQLSWHFFYLISNQVELIQILRTGSLCVLRRYSPCNREKNATKRLDGTFAT